MERRPDRFVAILDANVLVGALTRNLLLHLAEAGFYRPRWSVWILDEMRRALERQNKPVEYLDRLFLSLNAAFPEACVEDWEVYEATIVDLPDKDDKHVLAAAVKCDASVIITENLKDFPAVALDPVGVEPVNTDSFIADLIDLNQSAAINAIERMREGFRRPEYTRSDLVNRMSEIGLVQAAAILAGYASSDE
ncbi:MAG: PIN domain-containing protein [Pikeienuella sp.]